MRSASYIHNEQTRHDRNKSRFYLTRCYSMHCLVGWQGLWWGTASHVLLNQKCQRATCHQGDKSSPSTLKPTKYPTECSNMGLHSLTPLWLRSMVVKYRSVTGGDEVTTTWAANRNTAASWGRHNGHQGREADRVCVCLNPSNRTFATIYSNSWNLWRNAMLEKAVCV